MTDGRTFAAALADEAAGGAEVFAPALAGDRWAWRRATPEALRKGPLDLGPARATEPIKALFFPPRGEVSRFFGEEDRAEAPERILVGARQCDLAALRILDYIFLEGDFVDPFYAARREKTLVITADCTAPYDVCFCTFVEGAPHAEKGFDLNLSPVVDGFVVEVGGERGEAFVKKHEGSFKPASDADVKARDDARAKVRAELEAHVRSDFLDFPEKVRHITRGREEHHVWDSRAQDCVECGACNFVCPTCHCFYLLDCQEKEGVRRFAEWDSCLYPKFARVAGGANPRARRAERLLNRFEKKFSFFCDTIDALACTGCGRCVEACAGKIDLRDILKELAR
ncbi:MAG: 4Fe-4S dicluster domain-containing protein [Planctomycetota bacterium]